MDPRTMPLRSCAWETTQDELSEGLEDSVLTRVRHPGGCCTKQGSRIQLSVRTLDRTSAKAAVNAEMKPRY